MSCGECGSPLGCAVDCGTAPWNWDLPRTSRFGFLKRLGKWLRGDERREKDFPLYVSWPSVSELRWRYR